MKERIDANEPRSLFSAVRQGIDGEQRLGAHGALNVIERKVERLSEVHRRLILAVTPGSGSFLHAKGPKSTAEDAEAYSALFSEWHSATRDLRRLVDE
jgi:hypothetical protein